METRWKDNLSFVTGLPWKCNEKHEVGEEVILDTTPSEPSAHPETTPLPPSTLEEPIKAVRRLSVKVSDLDPASGGIGFTEGCKGCISIISGATTKQSHDERCRIRLIAKASVDHSVAARVETA